MGKLKLALVATATCVFVMNAQAAETTKSKTKKPETTVEETHPERDHTVEADDVNVKREKTVYSSTTNAKSVNLRMNPLLLLVGYANLDVDIKLSNMVTLGPSIGYLNYTSKDIAGDVKSYAYDLGIRANIYPGAEALAEHGWYIGPSLHYIYAKAELGTKSAELSGYSFNLVGGYHWIWESFNLMLGAGLSATSFPDKATVKDSSGGAQQEVTVSSISKTGGMLEATLGFAF
jgi:hypothetical protein